MAIWYILWSFGNLLAIWYIFPRFGILCQKFWQPRMPSRNSDAIALSDLVAFDEIFELLKSLCLKMWNFFRGCQMVFLKHESFF
jgi:hypothetical protein